VDTHSRSLIHIWHARFRALTTVICAVAGIGLAVATHGPLDADGPLLDLLIKSRSLVFPPAETTVESPVAVIAVDARSLQKPELARYPRVLLAPVWATVLNGVGEAGARAVGFDFIFGFSATNFDALPSGYDRSFLEALGRYRDRVVLARSVNTLPAMPFQAALRDDAALGIMDLAADSDGVYRRIPAGYADEQGTTVPSFADALLRRAGAPAISGAVVPAPRRHLERIPTYAIADVLRCAGQAPEALTRAFRDKIVLIGTTLPEEDRKRTSGRYLPPPREDEPPGHPCGLRRLGASDPDTRTVPGVFLHAAAIESVVTGRALKTMPWSVITGLTALTAATGSVAGLLLAPWSAIVVVAGLCALLFGAATILLQQDVWLPPGLPLLVMAGATLLAYVVRYLVEERARRLVQQELVFLSGLPRWMLDRIASGAGSLDHGGHVGDVTIMFADLSGFTRMSTRVPPEQLKITTSRYLAYIVQEVESTGGWVNQFIGDCVMAIWGAPLPDPDHAIHATQAALAAVERITREREAAEQRGELGFDIKIGLNSGQAYVGKLGTASRGTYSAAGETVNLAARLESVPGIYHCKVVVGPRTADLAGRHYLLRQLDTIRVKGIERPIPVFEPLMKLPANSDQQERARRYAEALAHYRAARFADAATAWDALAGSDLEPCAWRDGRRVPVSPSAVMARRAKGYADSPPQQSWDGVWVMTSK
jgi:adenylate cyclase